MSTVLAKGPLVFVPIRAIRCAPGGSSHTHIGHIGYYGGRKVIRFKCRSEECRYCRLPDGTKQRIVTFHHDDLDTGERVLPDERRPYEPPDKR